MDAPKSKVIYQPNLFEYKYGKPGKCRLRNKKMDPNSGKFLTNSFLDRILMRFFEEKYFSILIPTCYYWFWRIFTFDFIQKLWLEREWVRKVMSIFVLFRHVYFHIMNLSYVFKSVCIVSVWSSACCGINIEQVSEHVTWGLSSRHHFFQNKVGPVDLTCCCSINYAKRPIFEL